MRVTTRPGGKADLDFARTAHHAAYRDVVIRQWGRWDEQLQDQFFAKDWGDAQFDVIMVDGVACGYTDVKDRAEDIHVRELVLHPSHQGRGIGSSFMAEIVARAEARGVPVRLGTCIQNHRAIAFYRRHGFRETGRTETHVLMERGIGRANGP